MERLCIVLLIAIVFIGAEAYSVKKNTNNKEKSLLEKLRAVVLSEKEQDAKKESVNAISERRKGGKGGKKGGSGESGENKSRGKSEVEEEAEEFSAAEHQLLEHEVFWGEHCDFSVLTEIFTRPEPVTGDDIMSALSDYGSYIQSARNDFDQHHKDVEELESTFGTADFEDLMGGHMNVAMGVIETFLEHAASRGFCAYGRLIPLVYRMEFFGIANVTRCRHLISLVFENAPREDLEEGSEEYVQMICSLGDVDTMEAIGNSLRDDVKCIYNELDKMANFGQKRSEITHSDIMAFMAAVLAKGGAVGLDNYLLVVALDTIGQAYEEYELYKNQCQLPERKGQQKEVRELESLIEMLKKLNHKEM